MTGEVGSEVNLEVNDLKLLSQEAADSPVDSGQGSFETLEPLSERDSDEDSFVILDEPKTNRELEALKQRFWRHANPAASPRACQTVNVNIIVKDLGTNGKEELKAEVVPVTLAAEKLEGASHAKPGEKLQMLKAKLQEAMKLRRLEERQKRQALFKLDNEDGFEEEEEEEEMTDESEEDGEEEVGEEEEEDQDIQETTEYLLGSEDTETKDEKETDKENTDTSSDVGSEDEYDGEEIDEYEEDVIDEVLPSDEELESQIKKIHMKTMLDDDKRRLRLYQERYLADGDLHSDGPGRTRKFRWKHIDDTSQMDLFHRDSDDDQVEEQLDETEAKWRKERIEREQWLREQAQQGKIAADEEDIGDDSQFMMLAKKVTAKALQKNASHTVVVQESKSVLRNPFETIRPGGAHQLKTGSLLNQPKAVLQKLAALSDLNPSAPRNSRNFVFHTLSPTKAEAAKDSSKPQVRRRGLSSMMSPSPKRLKTNGSSPGPKRSIFRYLES